jgi:hypothetical protein
MKTMHQITPNPVDSKDKTNKESSGFGITGQAFLTPLWSGGRESHASATPLVVGAFVLAANDHALAGSVVSMVFRAIAANGSTPLTTHAKLVNVTDGEDVATLNFVDTTNAEKQETVLTIGLAVGNIKATERLYEVQVYVDAPGGPSDTIELYSAEVRVVNTVL